MIIGITGNIGSGKSTFIEILTHFFEQENLSYQVINLDKLGHKQLKENKILFDQLVKAFGKEIIENGKINRKKLGQIVFQNQTQLNHLNQLIHPLMIKDLKSQLQNQKNFFLIDGALIYEMKIDHLCDIVVTVDTQFDLMLERVMKRENLSKNEVLLRYNKQLDSRFKMKNADYVIENNSTIENLKNETKFFFDKLIQSKKII